MIDKELILRRFGDSFETYDQRADVQRRICGRLFELLSDRDLDVRRAFEIGAGTGFLTRHLVCRWPQAEWFVNDLVPSAERFLAPIAPAAMWLWGDAEALGYPQNLDLIASASTVQWFVDMPGFVRKSAAALDSGGVLALSSFGPHNFHEIRSSAATGLEYLSLSDLAKLIERAGFSIIHAGEYTETLSFDTPHDVLRYIKSLGLNALSAKTYTKTFDRTTLTYHPLLIVAKKS